MLRIGVKCWVGYTNLFLFSQGIIFSIPSEHALCVAKASCLAQVRSFPIIGPSSTPDYAVVTYQLVWVFSSVIYPSQNTHPIAKSTVYYQIWSLNRQTQ